MAGEDGERIEWLPPQPAGPEPPRFDPSRPDPLAQPPPEQAPDAPAQPPPAPTPPPQGQPGQPPPGAPTPPPQGQPGQPPQGPPAQPRPGPPAYSQPPAWQQPAGGPWPQPYAKAPGNTAAVASLWCGIAGLVTFVFPAGFGLVFVFNLPCSILAWVLGVSGRRKVDRGETYQHRGTAQTGIALGVIGVVLGVLAIVGWALAIALSDEVRDELRRAFDQGRNG